MWIASLVIHLLSVLCGLAMLWKLPGLSSPPSVETSHPDLQDVSVIIPAYNETHRLTPLLESLKRQQILPKEILIVDDHSTDNTGQLSRSFGFQTILADPVVPGWVGKSRACWSGAKKASGSILVFLDADTRLDQADSLSRILLAFNRQGQKGILSIQPYHKITKLYENLSAIFNIIVLAGLSRFSILGSRIDGTGAFGPCLVCNKADYFKTGGHEAIHEAILDDLALGDLFAAQELPVNCASGRQVLSFCMYPEGLSRLIEGWTKNFASASSTTHPFVLVCIILWIGGGFSTIGELVRALVTGSTIAVTAALFCCLAYLAVFVFQARRAGNFRWFALVIYPLHFLFFAALFTWSIYLTRIRRSVSWRGRKIKV